MLVPEICRSGKHEQSDHAKGAIIFIARVLHMDVDSVNMRPLITVIVSGIDTKVY